MSEKNNQWQDDLLKNNSPEDNSLKDKPLEDDPDYEDSLGDPHSLNERYSFPDDSLGRDETLLYLRRLHKDLLTKQSELCKIQNHLQEANLKLQQNKLALQKNTAALEFQNQEKLTNLLNINQQLQNNFSSLQMQFTNMQGYADWLSLQCVYFYRLSDEILQEKHQLEYKKREEEDELNEKETLRLEAEKARSFPYLTPAPFRYTPFPTKPLK